MRTLICEQNSPTMGLIKIKIRFIQKLIYMKFNNVPQKNNMINNLRSKGAIITEGQGWLRINIFGTNERVKLGEMEFGINDHPPEVIEKILFTFFYGKYLEAKFLVKEEKE